MSCRYVEIENELTLNEIIIEKREEEIADLQSKVLEVNEIFKDLATIVVSQRAGLEAIEENVANAATRTEKGVEELAKATESQRKGRGNMVCLLFVLLLIAGGIVFYLYVLHPKFGF